MANLRENSLPSCRSITLASVTSFYEITRPWAQAARSGAWTKPSKLKANNTKKQVGESTLLFLNVNLTS